MATIDELRARAELIAEETQIGGNTAERVGEAFDMVADIIESGGGGGGGSADAVLYTEQSLTPTQQGQARTNIDAQQTLVSGTNIKTVGGYSLLGNGDLELDNVEVTQSATDETTEISINDVSKTIVSGATPIGDAVKYTAPTWEAMDENLSDKINYTDLLNSIDAFSTMPVQAQAIYHAIQSSANVQADWDVTNQSDGAYIKNKPNIVKNMAGSGSDTTTSIKAGNNDTYAGAIRLEQSTASISGASGSVAINSNGVEITAGNSGYPNAKAMYNGAEIATVSDVPTVEDWAQTSVRFNGTSVNLSVLDFKPPISNVSGNGVGLKTTDPNHEQTISFILGTADTTYSLGGWDRAGNDNTLLTMGLIKEKFYQKPSTGIPASDLASAVQTSLGLANTALQSYTETDPVFAASAAAGITSTDIAAWNAKQAALTFDEYPTDSSSNPVKSGGVYTILTTKQDKMFLESVSGGGVLRAGLNYYHKMTTAVNTFNIILPVPQSIVYVNHTIIEFTTGTTPNITFTSTATVTTSLTFEANTHYLIDCYYSVNEWIVDSVDARERLDNKVTTLSASSTDVKYPSAKAVYDALATKQDTLVSGTTIKTINAQSLLGSGNIKTDTQIVTQTAATVEIQPNVLNVWGEAASLTITLATPTDNTIVNEYMVQFESGTTATTLSLPNSVIWGDSCGALSVEASKIYQISIIDNLATWESWATS